MEHLTFHISKWKFFLCDKQKPNQKQKVWPNVDAIKYRLVVVIENIFHTRQTCLKGKEYLVKYKGYNHKEAMWMKRIHLDHLLDMVAKFQQENGHKFGVKKNLKGKKKPT